MRIESSAGSHRLRRGRRRGSGHPGSAAISLTAPHSRSGGVFWCGSVSPGEGGSSSMQLPLKMESSTEEESWLEDQWEKW